MFKLSVKIWWKGVIVYAILCIALAIPTLFASLIALVLGSLISLPSIFLYAFFIYILKRSEANSSHAIMLLFIASVFAVLFVLRLTVFIDNSNPFNFQVKKFYLNPAFYIPWACAGLGIRFSRKHIRQFFSDENMEQSN